MTPLAATQTVYGPETCGTHSWPDEQLCMDGGDDTAQDRHCVELTACVVDVMVPGHAACTGGAGFVIL